MTAGHDGAVSERSDSPQLKLPPPPLLVKGPDDRVIEYKMQNMSFVRKARNRIGMLIFNAFVTHIPSHNIRQGFLRLFGATIGKDSAIMRGTNIVDIEFLTIGNNTAIGGRCFLDARAGIAIGDNVTIASDTQFICGGHEINHPDFLPTISPTVVEDYVWIASRAMVLPCHIGRGAVVAAQSLVNKDVAPLAVVGGVPAKVISQRKPEGLGYSGKYRPLFS